MHFKNYMLAKFGFEFPNPEPELTLPYHRWSSAVLGPLEGYLHLVLIISPSFCCIVLGYCIWCCSLLSGSLPGKIVPQLFFAFLRPFLKLDTVGAFFTCSGNSFHFSATLWLKKFLLGSDLDVTLTMLCPPSVALVLWVLSSGTWVNQVFLSTSSTPFRILKAVSLWPSPVRVSDPQMFPCLTLPVFPHRFYLGGQSLLSPFFSGRFKSGLCHPFTIEYVESAWLRCARLGIFIVLYNTVCRLFLENSIHKVRHTVLGIFIVFASYSSHIHCKRCVKLGISIVYHC